MTVALQSHYEGYLFDNTSVLSINKTEEDS